MMASGQCSHAGAGKESAMDVRRAQRVLVSGFVALMAGPLYALFRGVGLPLPVAVVVVVAVSGAAIVKLAPRVPSEIASVLAGKKLLWAWLLMTMLAAVQLGSLAVFMSDSTARPFAVMPSSDFSTEHNCYTAYFEGVRIGHLEPNVYEPTLYRPAPRSPRFIDGFTVDAYEYPPPFLVFPAIARLLSQSFLTHRTLFFSFECFLLAAAVVAVARRLQRPASDRLVLLLPLFFLALPIRSTLQSGNFQLAAVAMAVLAWTSFARNRNALGGALLGFAVVSKLFPGLLLVYFLARGKLRPVAATIVAAAGFAALALLLFGADVYRAFFSFHVPRLISGDAFPMLKFVPPAILINHSVYGIVLKAKLLGLTTHGMETAARIAWGYTIVLLAVTVMIARRAKDEFEPRAMLAILALGALRAPFLPVDYGTLVPITIAVVALASGPSTRRSLWFWIIAFAMLNILFPFEWFKPKFPPPLFLATLSQLAHFAVVIAAVRQLLRVDRVERAPATPTN